MPPSREWFDTDYYAVLGVKPKATDKEITKAYRKLARKHHPDATDGNEERFKQISSAYAVVGSADKRKEYDEARRLGAAGAYSTAPGGGRGHASGPSGYTRTTYAGDMSDLGDTDLGHIFRNLFGGPGPGSRSGGPGQANFAMKGVDLESRISLSFRDAVSGLTTTITLGADPANGASISSNRRVNVRIPSGVNNGQRIRLAGKGGAGRNGGPSGDLYVVVEVKPDPVFSRKGVNLTMKVPITYPQAALGDDLKIQTFDGAIVTLKVPAGTQSGATFRVKGRGVKTAKKTGDLLVTTDIKVPKKLSRSERELVTRLAELDPADTADTKSTSSGKSRKTTL